MIANLLAWAAQVFLVVIVAAAASFALSDARARLYFWQGILAVILLLPAVALWQQPAPRAAIVMPISQPTTMAVGAPLTEAPAPVFNGQYLLDLLAVGTALRLAWLTIGLFRLRRFRRQAVALHQPPVAFAGNVGWYLSDSVSGPVTYGWPRSWILLPARFPDMPASVQEAIASHELMHVHRGDWLFVMGEEIVRGLLWFHPAVWFVLSRIQLAREQVVDREVVQATNDRAGYLDALMAVAAQKLQPDVAPAPLFLKRRQLAVRVAAILKETSMSSSGLIARVSAAAFAAVLGVFAALWLFPLEIPAQTMPDAPGITVEAGAPLLHRPPLRSPDVSITGDVIVEATVNTKGEVTDARVLSGPVEARKAVLASVLDWHYSTATIPPQLVRIVVHFATVPGSQVTRVPPPPPPPPPPPQGPSSLPPTSLPREGPWIHMITFTGLSPELYQQIQSRMTIRTEDTLRAADLSTLRDTLQQIDKHLTVTVIPLRGYAVQLSISLQGAGPIQIAPPSVPTPARAYTGPPPVQIEPRLLESMLVSKTSPAYPVLAKSTRIQGPVTYSVIIGTDGTIQYIQLISGNPMLATDGVTDAVSQWVYRPYVVDGKAVPVQAQIVVNFVLM